MLRHLEAIPISFELVTAWWDAAFPFFVPSGLGATVPRGIVLAWVAGEMGCEEAVAEATLRRVERARPSLLSVALGRRRGLELRDADPRARTRH